MPIFEFTDPQGAKFRVTAPEGASEQDAFSMLQQHNAPSPGEKLLGVAKQAGAGLLQGMEGVASWPAQVLGMAGRGVEALGFNPNPEAAAEREKLRGMIEANRNGGISQYLPEPQNDVERYTRTAAEFVPGMGGAGSIVRRAGTGIAAGLGSEAAGQAFGNDPTARMLGALGGGLATAGRGAGLEARQAAQGAASDIKGLASKLYGVNEQATAGTPVGKGFMQDVTNAIKERLNEAGIRKINSQAHEMLDALPNKIDDAYDVVKAREVLRKDLNAAGDPRAAYIVTDSLNKVIDHLSSKGVGVLQSADREYSIGKTLEALNKRYSKIEDQTAATNSGRNLGNKYRQGLTQLKNSGDTKGLTADELAQIDRVIEGGNIENTLRSWSNRLGGGGGLGQIVAGGGTAGLAHMMGADPSTSAALGIGAGISGQAARMMANRIAQQKANALRQMIAQRSALRPDLSMPSTGLLSLLPTARSPYMGPQQ